MGCPCRCCRHRSLSRRRPGTTTTTSTTTIRLTVPCGWDLQRDGGESGRLNARRRRSRRRTSSTRGRKKRHDVRTVVYILSLSFSLHSRCYCVSTLSWFAPSLSSSVLYRTALPAPLDRWWSWWCPCLLGCGCCMLLVYLLFGFLILTILFLFYPYPLKYTLAPLIHQCHFVAGRGNQRRSKKLKLFVFLVLTMVLQPQQQELIGRIPTTTTTVVGTSKTIPHLKSKHSKKFQVQLSIGK